MPLVSHETNIETIVSGSTVTVHVGLGATNVACTRYSDILRISGVRLKIADEGLTGSIEAGISASGDFALGSGASRVTVVNSVVDELADDGVTTDLAPGGGDEGELVLVRNSGAPMADSGHPLGKTRAFVVWIDENNVDSFEDAELDLEFSGIPPDATIELDAWAFVPTQTKPSPNTATRVTQANIDDPDNTGDDALMDADLAGNDEVSVEYEAGAEGVTAEDNEAVILMILDANGDGVPDDLGDDGTHAGRSPCLIRSGPTASFFVAPSPSPWGPSFRWRTRLSK